MADFGPAPVIVDNDFNIGTGEKIELPSNGLRTFFALANNSGNAVTVNVGGENSVGVFVGGDGGIFSLSEGARGPIFINEVGGAGGDITVLSTIDEVADAITT